MIYMVGSNLESKNMAGSNDISEILDSELDISKVNLLIYTGGATTWHANVPKDANATLLLSEKDGKREMKMLNKTKKLKNMGEAETFSSFLNYAYKNFPARHYGLICWDHGNGPVGGFGNDERFNGDALEIDELKKGFEASKFNEKNKLDFIGFDACLMSSLEIADTLSGYAEYMIASQETEPGEGWDYSFLKTLNEPYDTEKLAEVIVNSYTKYYEAERSSVFNPNLTLACMDLSKMTQVNKAMDDLFGKMDETLAKEYYKRTAERSSLKSFGDFASYERGWSMDLVDAGNFAEESAADFPAESKAFKKALDNLVVKNGTNVSNANGISMYYPYNGEKSFEEYGKKKYKNFNGSGKYLGYMDKFIKRWTDKKSVEKADESDDDDYSGAEVGENEIKIKLKKSQKKSFKKAYLNIYQNKTGSKGVEHFSPVLYGEELTPDEKGNIVISTDEKIPTINGRIPLQLIQKSKDDKVINYESVAFSIWSADTDVKQEATMFCSRENGSDDILINSIELNDKDNNSRSKMGKNTIDLDRWETLIFTLLYAAPKKNKSGQILNFGKWNFNDPPFMGGRSADIEEDMDFRMEKISKTHNLKQSDFSYQISIEDKDGNITYTEPKDFKDEFKTKEYKQKTGKGEFTYILHEDYAELKRYKGNDKKLTIPYEVKGLPVTRIGYEAFASLRKDNENPIYIDSLMIENPKIDLSNGDFSNIKKVILPEGLKEIPSRVSFTSCEEVVIPDSVEKIGRKAFSGAARIKKLVLPEKLRYIGAGAFEECWFKEGVSFKGNNKNFRIENNMLLSKDRKKLYAIFPQKNVKVVTIPEGVEIIEPYAHSGGLYNDYKNYNEHDNVDMSLTGIKFPRSLKNIRFCAFNDKFKEIIIPDNVEKIGHYAFANSFFGYGENLYYAQKLKIGRKVSWIGENILGKNSYKKLEVSVDNRFYSVKNNKLTNKYGDTDFTDISLSSEDNTSRNAAEYAAYRYVMTGLNSSAYKAYSSDFEKSYYKYYEGKKYGLDLELKDSEKTKYKPDSKIKIAGIDLKLPFKLKELTKSAFTFEKTEDKNKKVDSFGSCDLMDKKGNQLNASLITGKNDLPEDCYVEAVDMDNFLSQKAKVAFDYKGLNWKSSLKDFVKTLGAPTRFNIDYSEDYVTLRLYYKDFGISQSGDQNINAEFKFFPNLNETELIKFELDEDTSLEREIEYLEQ